MNRSDPYSDDTVNPARCRTLVALVKFRMCVGLCGVCECDQGGDGNQHVSSFRFHWINKACKL